MRKHRLERLRRLTQGAALVGFAAGAGGAACTKDPPPHEPVHVNSPPSPDPSGQPSATASQTSTAVASAPASASASASEVPGPGPIGPIVNSPPLTPPKTNSPSPKPPKPPKTNSPSGD